MKDSSAVSSPHLFWTQQNKEGTMIHGSFKKAILTKGTALPSEWSLQNDILYYADLLLIYYADNYYIFEYLVK